MMYMYIYFLFMYVGQSDLALLYILFWSHYIGVVGRMASKLVLLPEPYSGELGSWDDWIDHFECIVEVNKWATREEKLKWLRVRLTGKALTALRKLPESAHCNYAECKTALKKQFDSDSKRELHVAELQMRTRG